MKTTKSRQQRVSTKVEKLKVKPKEEGLREPGWKEVLGVKREGSLWMRKPASVRKTDKNLKWQQICSILSPKGKMNIIRRSTWVQLKEKCYFGEIIDFWKCCSYYRRTSSIKVYKKRWTKHLRWCQDRISCWARFLIQAFLLALRFYK